MFLCLYLQVLRYFDYVFTGVFTFEMLIKVNTLNTSNVLKHLKHLLSMY